MTRVYLLVYISLLAVVFSAEVFSFPAFSRGGAGVFPGENGDKRPMKKRNWETGQDFPTFPPWPWFTRDEKRTAINNKHEWRDKGFPHFPERPPWPWHIPGKKRSAINQHFWPIDKDNHFPNIPPWTPDGEKRSAINFKNEWKEKLFPFPPPQPWFPDGEN